MEFDPKKLWDDLRAIAGAEAEALAERAKIAPDEAADVQRAIEAEAAFYLAVGTMSPAERTKAVRRLKLYRSGLRNLTIAKAIDIEDEVRDAARRSVRQVFTVGLNLGVALLA